MAQLAGRHEALTVRFYRLKRETSEGSFSLLNAQITVGELSDTRGTRLKGIGILEPNSFVEYPVVVMLEQAADIAACLDRALRHELPAQVRLRYGWLNLRGWSLSLDSYDEKWLGEGGFKGSLSPRPGRWLPVTMSNTAVRGLRGCLLRFYGLQKVD